MKKMEIYEPAMCCDTGICGVGVDPELLRMSAVLDRLKKNGIEVERFNLSSAPMEFMTNRVVNDLINEENGLDNLPCTVLEGEIVITGRYPTNEEIAEFLDVPVSSVNE